MKDITTIMSAAARGAADYPAGYCEGYPDSFKQSFRTFYKYIQNGDYEALKSFPTFLDGHREMILCEAILKSHQEQRWVQISQHEGPA